MFASWLIINCMHETRLEKQWLIEVTELPKSDNVNHRRDISHGEQQTNYWFN